MEVGQVDLLRLLDFAATQRTLVEFVGADETADDMTARTEGTVDAAVHAHVTRQRVLNLPNPLLQKLQWKNTIVVTGMIKTTLKLVPSSVYTALLLTSSI